jgi:hypothetical protein
MPTAGAMSGQVGGCLCGHDGLEVHLVRRVPIGADGTTDFAHFPSAGHLISRAGPCPRNDENAGVRCFTQLRKVLRLG